MTNFEKAQSQQENSTDIIAKIVTARDEARGMARIYKYHPNKQYDYWRAMSAVITCDDVLDMFESGDEHKIPDMAAKAAADFERVRDNEDPEMILAVMDGHRDALVSVVDWMNNEKSNR